jgi:hypothetical protein
MVMVWYWYWYWCWYWQCNGIDIGIGNGIGICMVWYGICIGMVLVWYGMVLVLVLVCILLSMHNIAMQWYWYWYGMVNLGLFFVQNIYVGSKNRNNSQQTTRRLMSYYGPSYYSGEWKRLAEYKPSMLAYGLNSNMYTHRLQLKSG